jgi:hypothetical protein
MRETKIVYRSLVERSFGKCPLGRLQRSCKDNIKMHLHERGCEDGRWLEVVQYHGRW